MFTKLKIITTIGQGLIIVLIVYMVMLMYYNSTGQVPEHVHVYDDVHHITTLPNSIEYPNMLDDMWGFLPDYYVEGIIPATNAVENDAHENSTNIYLDN